MPSTFDLTSHGIQCGQVLRNAAPAQLYEEAVRRGRGSVILANGALMALSGAKTGRSPNDKRIVCNPDTPGDIWWGQVNIPLDPASYAANRRRAIEYLNQVSQLYVVDGFAGWDPEYQIKVRIICERAYHALFMHNMLIRPSRDQLENFGKPDFVVFNAGACLADSQLPGVGTETSICLNFESAEAVILGSEYAGEMKKGVFTLMHGLMPRRQVFSMHCSANQGSDGDVSIFFGLSGTGKTTLSADPERFLIGDDEHCWSDEGIFNIEGGCYAKMIDLSEEFEPEIYRALRFGAVLENVIYDEVTREIDYGDTSITTNTRGAYPIEYVKNALVPCVGNHPSNIIFLTCDAFGVLPPVSRLTPAQAMYHFISGYTAKVAGTEVGVTDPEATFSACFGAPFLVLHPTRYAEMLADKMSRHSTNTWLVNTGWSGGAYGTGSRIKLYYTRAIIDAIHSGALETVEWTTDSAFGLSIPTSCPGVPDEILAPRNTWSDQAAYDTSAARLAALFHRNFENFSDAASQEIRDAAPQF